MNTSHTRRSLINAAAAVISEAAIKVPQKFIDHARRVGSTTLFAELTYRNWSKRGLTDQQILDKISKHGEEQKKEEAVIEEGKKTVKALAVGDKVHGYTNNNAVVKKVKVKTANRNNYFKIVFDDGSDAILHAGHEFTLAEESTELEEASTTELGFRKVEKMIGAVIDELNPSRSDWAKNVIKADPENKQHIVNAFNLVKEADGELNDIVIKSIKKSLDNMDEAVIEEDSGKHTPSVTKAINFVKGYDAEEMESFLLALAEYFEWASSNNGDDFDKTSKSLAKAYQTWKARRGN
jgi:hypothetical protein